MGHDNHEQDPIDVPHAKHPAPAIAPYPLLKLDSGLSSLGAMCGHHTSSVQHFTVPPLFLSESGHSSRIQQNPVDSTGLQTEIEIELNLVANTCVYTVVNTNMVYKLTFVVCQ